MKTILLVWFLISYSTFALSAIQGPFTLKKALYRAFEENLALKQAKEKIVESDKRVNAAYGGLLPLINGSAKYSLKKDPVASPLAAFGGDPYNSYEVGLEVRQYLYKGGAIWGNINNFEKENELRKLDYRSAETDVALQVALQFFKILLEDSRSGALEKTINVQKSLLERTKKRVQVGTSRRLEALQIETQLDLITPQLLQSGHQRNVAALELAKLLNLTQDNRFELRGTLEPIKVEKIRDRLKKENKERIEYTRVQTQLAQFEEKKTLELADHMPSAYLFGNWGRVTNKKTSLVDDDTTAWSAGVQITIPIFSGLSSFSQRSALNSAKLGLETERLKVLDSIGSEQIRVEKELAVVSETIAATERALSVAVEAEKEATKQYQLATGTYLQLSESQKNRLSAELALYQSQYDYWIALARYIVAFGYSFKDLEDLIP